MNHPQFSIIIPTFQRIGLLQECLLAIRAQDFEDFEVIVVDDDADPLVAEMIRENFPQVRYYKQKRLGPGAARNLGASHALGVYLTFVDDDDLLDHRYLSTINQLLDTDPSVEMIFVQQREFSCSAEWRDFANHQEDSLRITRFENVMEYMLTEGAFSGTAVWAALKKSHFLSTDGFVIGKINMEDVDWLLRSSNLGCAVRIDSPILLGYRLHQHQVSSSVVKSHRGLVNIFRSEIADRCPAVHRDLRIKRVNRSLQYWLTRYTPGMIVYFLQILYLGFRAFGFGFFHLLPSCIYCYIKGCYRFFKSYLCKLLRFPLRA